MMGCFSLVIGAALASLCAAKSCINQTVPITISSRQGVYGNLTVPQTQIEVTAFAQAGSVQESNATAAVATGFETVNGTYNISTQFCAPDQPLGNDPTVQVLTHGIGFDKTYWDLSYNDFNYSYVNVATDHYGYYTLSYDRLGIGNSSHGEPRDEIQQNLEVAALAQLSMLLRQGAFPGVDKSFNKVVHVGHSFGSAQTTTLVNMYPNISDAVALTGFSYNSSFSANFLLGSNFEQANTNNPARFSDYPNGYVIGALEQSIQEVFFYYPYFDPCILTLANATKQPVTVGELLTLPIVPMANSYAGPVLVLTGDNDSPFCGGNCSNTGLANLSSIPAAVQKAFPLVPATNFTAYVQPNTAHGINLHYNATGAYDVINEFFNSKGLASK